jgi:hypothetical protein
MSETDQPSVRPGAHEESEPPPDSRVHPEPTNASLSVGSIKQRRYVAAALVIVVTLTCVLIGKFSSAPSLWTAVLIFGVSLIGFHSIALLTADCTRLWRCAGYPLALTGFMAILSALAGIQETARLQPLNAAIADRNAAYDALTYSLKSVITNDCHPKATRAVMYSPSPEPYEGACERMEHFLPQIELAAAAESSVEGLNSGEGWGLDIIIPDSKPTGAWLGLYNDAARFTESVKRTAEVLKESKKTPQNPIAKWAASGAIRNWYFVLAFFLGLQLSKISAELLATNPGETPPAQILVKFFHKVFTEPRAFWKRGKATPS